MLRNYLKIAIAVLRRRWFFTFISLFGISLTLATIMVVAAFFTQFKDPGYPDVHRDRMLYATSLYRWGDGNKHNINGGALSYYFYRHYASNLKIPESVALSSSPTRTNTYIDNKKLGLDLRYTDEHFWDVLQFQFLEGKPYNRAEIDNADNIAVITDELRNDYFGKGEPAVGKYIEADNVQYRVIGVVRGDVRSNEFSTADVYLPYTLSRGDLKSTDISGSYFVLLMAHNKSEVPAMRREFDEMVDRIPVSDPVMYDHQKTWADPFLATYTRHLFGISMSNGRFRVNGDGITWFYLCAGLITFLFMLIPTINMININVTRIMERSSEIGVRKSFGASSGTLVLQFLVENVFLTLVGGLIGILLSAAALGLLNRWEPIKNLHLFLNVPALLYGLAACLFFGLLSGVYPAWRMSRLNVVTALKS